ncbi:MAG: hypothetical protein PVF70_04405 [Anaerolineales bacterium]|jgi:hypothetical protein
MAESRWQIIIGAVILMLMLLVGAFSLGVYIGEHGWTRQGLRYQPGPGDAQVQAPGPPPNQGPAQVPGNQSFPGQVGDEPDLVGRIRRLSPDGIELATPQGPRMIEWGAEVIVEDRQGVRLTPRDLKRDDIVAIFGEFIPGDGGRLVAHLIVRLPPPSQ